MPISKDEIKFISIVLGDNDFGTTFIYLLKSLNDINLLREPLSKEEVEKIIYGGIEFHYSAFQHGYIGGDLNLDTVVIYLKENITILFNQDAIKDKKENDHDGGAWILDLYSGDISSY